MIPYMNLEEQIDSDYVGARRRALLRRVMARFYKAHIHNRLLSFDEVREASLADSWIYIGPKIVEAEKIVGSVGRQNDFDRSFLPIRANVEASRQGVSPNRGSPAGEPVQDRGRILRPGRQPPRLRGPLSRRTNNGGRGDRVSASNPLRSARRRGDLYGRAHI